MTLLQRFFATDDSRHALLTRVALGAVLFPHGAQKLLGWFGGYGFSGTMGFFTGTLHVPAPLALLVILAESLGAVGLVFGLGTRLAAAGVSAVMLGAIAMTHAQHGFFMNWFGQQRGEGFEYHLLVLALALPLAWWGAGAASLDRVVAARLGEVGEPLGAAPQPA